MSAAKKGLGRGFSSLIPTELLDESFDPTAEQDERMSDLRHIKLAEITADPDQPRRVFDEVALDEMAASIREHGVLQPIVVTPYGDGYKIVAGERRWRASTMAGLDKMPALVRTLSDQHRLELSLIENLQRKDLNVLETATAYLKLRDQFNLTLEQIGKRVGGKSTSAVSNTLRLLRLPQAVRQALAEGKIREGQARPLLGVDEAIALDLLKKMIAEEWSARRVEQAIVDIKKQAVDAPAQEKAQKPVNAPYEEQRARLEQRLRVPITIRTNTKGAGKLTIAFKDEDELRRIEALIEGK